jgi:pilus assembly protein CpaE
MAAQLKAILVGCSQDGFPDLRHALDACSIEVEAEYPDVRAAIDGTRLSHGEDRLCMMRVSSREHVQPLKWLSECFVGRPLVALVDGASDSQLLFTINRAGAGQVLPLPLKPEDLQAALECIKVSHSPPLPVAARRLIAVSGVTGGCGATTIAINLAYEIAEQFGLSCILVDLARRGMVGTCLDLETRHTISDLLCDMASVDVAMVEKTLVPVTERFRVLPAPLLETAPTPAAPADVARLLDHVKHLADVVILDLPVLPCDGRQEAFAAVNQVLLVAEQSVPSLRALGGARDLIVQPETLFRQSLVINRYDPNKEGFSVTHLQRLMKTPQLVTISNDYAAVSSAMNEGRPLRLMAPASRVVGDLHRLARLLVTSGQAPPPPVRKTSSLGRFVRSLFGCA